MHSFDTWMPIRCKDTLNDEKHRAAPRLVEATDCPAYSSVGELRITKGHSSRICELKLLTYCEVNETHALHQFAIISLPAPWFE